MLTLPPSNPAQTFFNWRKLALSCLVNVALLVTAVATTGAFYKIRPEAGQLMLPYVIWWVSMAPVVV